GAFLDSTLDRYSEGAVYLGLAAYFVTIDPPLQEWLVLSTLSALAGSFLVSYVRARAQSLGFVCKTGLFQRPERVVVTVIGLQGRAQLRERERELKARRAAPHQAQ